MNAFVYAAARSPLPPRSGHMIPHAVHGFDGSGMPENLPYFLTLSGYMLIFFVEKVAFDTHTIMHDGSDGHGSVTAAGAGGSEVAAGPPSGRSAIILLLALGVHALMETMALGLSSDKLSAGLLAMSIGLHQVRVGLGWVSDALSLAGTGRTWLRHVCRVRIVVALAVYFGPATLELCAEMFHKVKACMCLSCICICALGPNRCLCRASARRPWSCMRSLCAVAERPIDSLGSSSPPS